MHDALTLVQESNQDIQPIFEGMDTLVNSPARAERVRSCEQMFRVLDQHRDPKGVLVAQLPAVIGAQTNLALNASALFRSLNDSGVRASEIGLSWKDYQAIMAVGPRQLHCELEAHLQPREPSRD